MRTLWTIPVFCLVWLVGCGGANSNPSPPAPPQPNLSVASPADNSTVVGLPVQITVTATNVTDASQVGVLLNGADITSQLSIAGQTWSGTVTPPEVNYGKNQIQVRYQDLRANTSFVFDTSSQGGLGQSGSPTLLVPVTTRVLRNNDPTVATNWGITVGGNTYWANAPVNCSSGACNRGMQFLLLNRQNLSVVSNTTYEVDGAGDILGSSPFGQALNAMSQSGVSGCSPSNCLVILQSLTYLPWNGCWGETVGNCNGRFAYAPDLEYEALNLARMGATDMFMFANWQNSNVGYSFIGNAGNGQSVNPNNNGGTGYERLGCSDSRSESNKIICDNLGAFSSSGNSPADPLKPVPSPAC